MNHFFVFSIATLFMLIVGFAPRDAHALTVAPAVFDEQFIPGDSLTKVVRLYNELPRTMEITTEVKDLIPTPEGDKTNYRDPDSLDGVETLAEWITFDKATVGNSKTPKDFTPLDRGFKLTIAPEERVEVTFTFHVPENVSPGGHYGGMFVGSKQSADEVVEGGEAKIAVMSEVIVVLAGIASGDLTEDSTLESFSAGGHFFEAPPVNFETTINNKGNIHIIPSGVIKILKGKDDVEAVPFNPDKERILPESPETFTTKWAPESWSAGRYQARLISSYLSYNDEDAIVTFWIIPWKRYLTWVGIVVGVLFALWILTKLVKRVIRRQVESSFSTKRRSLRGRGKH